MSDTYLENSFGARLSFAYIKNLQGLALAERLAQKVGRRLRIRRFHASLARILQRLGVGGGNRSCEDSHHRDDELDEETSNRTNGSHY